MTTVNKKLIFYACRETLAILTQVPDRQKSKFIREAILEKHHRDNCEKEAFAKKVENLVMDVKEIRQIVMELKDLRPTFENAGFKKPSDGKKQNFSNTKPISKRTEEEVSKRVYDAIESSMQDFL